MFWEGFCRKCLGRSFVKDILGGIWSNEYREVFGYDFLGCLWKKSVGGLQRITLSSPDAHVAALSECLTHVRCIIREPDACVGALSECVTHVAQMSAMSRAGVEDEFLGGLAVHSEGHGGRSGQQAGGWCALEVQRVGRAVPPLCQRCKGMRPSPLKAAHFPLTFAVTLRRHRFPSMLPLPYEVVL